MQVVGRPLLEIHHPQQPGHQDGPRRGAEDEIRRQQLARPLLGQGAAEQDEFHRQGGDQSEGGEVVEEGEECTHHSGLLRLSANPANIRLKLRLIRSSALGLGSTECSR